MCCVWNLSHPLSIHDTPIPMLCWYWNSKPTIESLINDTHARMPRCYLLYEDCRHKHISYTGIQFWVLYGNDSRRILKWWLLKVSYTQLQLVMLTWINSCQTDTNQIIYKLPAMQQIFLDGYCSLLPNWHFVATCKLTPLQTMGNLTAQLHGRKLWLCYTPKNYRITTYDIAWLIFGNTCLRHAPHIFISIQQPFPFWLYAQN